MIYFKFDLSNPWWRGKNDKPQVDYIEFEKKITKNKFVEMQISKMNPHELISLVADTCWFGQDHAGFEFTIEVYGFYFSVMLRDCRHWNYAEGRFMNEVEIQEEYEEYKRMKESRDNRPDEDYHDE